MRLVPRDTLFERLFSVSHYNIKVRCCLAHPARGLRSEARGDFGSLRPRLDGAPHPPTARLSSRRSLLRRPACGLRLSQFLTELALSAIMAATSEVKAVTGTHAESSPVHRCNCSGCMGSNGLRSTSWLGRLSYLHSLPHLHSLSHLHASPHLDHAPLAQRPEGQCDLLAGRGPVLWTDDDSGGRCS